MGAAPIWDGRLAAASPLRDPKTRTVSVPSIAQKPGPRRYFARIPTHAVGVASERRCYPRAALSLPLRLLSIGEVAEPLPVVLVTRNISSSGIFFFAPREIPVGAAVQLEVALVARALGSGSVQMRTAAHIVRIEDCDMPGWRGYAASFDDFSFQRDDVVPSTRTA